MRLVLVALAAIAPLALGGCEDPVVEGETPQDQTQAGDDDAAPAPPVGDVEAITPLEERVATIGLLNKRNNESQDLEMRPGEVREIGPVIVRLSTCERTAPWEMPQETGAFVQLDVLERGQSDHTRVFSGWLFKESPSLNVIEHPIYDVWVKDCAMRFPGDNAEDG
ncbi:MAG: DUF2155 domain-containing protein [Pseudomonadota bacterium]